MTSNQLTPWLKDQIESGNAVLFLGAGAVCGATGPNSERALSGPELRDKLCEKFLGGELKNRPLVEVAEFAKSESSLVEVQNYVAELFLPLQPAAFHRLIPKFRWYAIITTNYDQIVEIAYSEDKDRLQELGVILGDDDRFQDVMRDMRKVPYLKLHGSLSVLNDPKLPLILASEEYAKYLEGRRRLFNHFWEFARERPVIFCGYNVSDPNIQTILFDLADLNIRRPTYAIVSPDLTDYDHRYWSSRRFVPLRMKFSDFLTQIDAQIPLSGRVLQAARGTDPLSIDRWISSGQPTEQLRLYLQTELLHVHSGMAIEGANPAEFYKGGGSGWGAIAAGLDSERRITDDILIEAVLEHSETDTFRAFLLKGHAGSGKSVTLRRISWNAATDLDALVFWLSEGAVLRPSLIAELAQLVQRQMILVVDDALQHFGDILALQTVVQKENVAVTLITSARTNEWNVADAEQHIRTNSEYELRNLSNREIESILSLLKQHGCLGHLANLPFEEQKQFFELSASRQLLVALHEATYGISFEEIVLDEYKNVAPAEARTLYLDICTLNKFRVGVRAGLVSRVSGITFNYFGEQLMRPLEHVVHTYFDVSSRDYAYKTRHPVIADIVFQRVLEDQVDRSNQMVRVLRSMNTDYDSDRVAFEQLIRGRELATLFSDRALADRIFEAAAASGASSAHVEHQRAVFELNHGEGNLRAGLRAVELAAQDSTGQNQAILHTKALILRKLALQATSRIEKDKLRTDARAIVQRQSRRAKSSHAFNAIAMIALDQLREHHFEAADSASAGGANLRERIVGDLIAEAERALSEGLERFPGDSYLLSTESQLATFLDDEPRATDSLEKALRNDPGNAYIAARLARKLAKDGRVDEAERILRNCIEQNPQARAARQGLATLLITSDAEKNHPEIRTLLRSNFVEGDANYESQFLFAKQEFLHGDIDVAQRIFSSLRESAHHSPITDATGSGAVGSSRTCQGTVKTYHDSYCFVRPDQLRADVFIHAREFVPEEWRRISPGARVRFSLAFTMRGASGIGATLV